MPPAVAAAEQGFGAVMVVGSFAHAAVPVRQLQARPAAGFARRCGGLRLAAARCAPTPRRGQE
jgi:hypothetical protein